MNKTLLKLNPPINLDYSDVIFIDLSVVITGNVSLDDPCSLFLVVHVVSVVFAHHRLPTRFNAAVSSGQDPILGKNSFRLWVKITLIKIDYFLDIICKYVFLREV